MPHRFLSHTADLAMAVEAASVEALFADALAGLTDCITELERVRAVVVRRLELAGAELDLLLVDWLGEAVAAFETRGELYGRAAVRIEREARGVRLSAELHGERYDGERHPLKVLVKGVTYHRLRVEAPDAGNALWRARVVFDI